MDKLMVDEREVAKILADSFTEGRANRRDYSVMRAALVDLANAGYEIQHKHSLSALGSGIGDTGGAFNDPTKTSAQKQDNNND